MAGPFDLLQPSHLGVVVGEVVEEHPQCLGSPGHCVGAQRGGDRLHVANDLGTDQRLADTGGMNGWPDRHGPALPRRDGQAAELVAGLL